jgi:hypothetical protein
MGQTVPGSERRRSLRAPVHGVAVLHRDRGAARGHIENLSLGGVLVRMRADRPEAPAGPEWCDVELRLSPLEKVILVGEVVRTEARRGELWIAIRFDGVSPDHEDVIEDRVVDALESGRPRPVLVVDGVEERRTGLAAALRDRRMTPLTPRTPLEMIDLLSHPERKIAVCVISPHFGDLRGREIATAIQVADDAITTIDDVQAAWDELDASALSS